MTYQDIKLDLDILTSRMQGEFMFMRRKYDNVVVGVFLVNQNDLNDKNVYHYYTHEQCPPVDYTKTDEFTPLSHHDVTVTYGDIYEFRSVLKERTWNKFKTINVDTKAKMMEDVTKWMGRNVSYCNAEYVVVGFAADALDLMWVLVNENLDVACTPCAAPMLESQEDAEVCAEFHKKVTDNWDAVNNVLNTFNSRFDEVVLIARYDAENDKMISYND